MAPELVRGEAKPSADTDLHSFAVLLFYLLMDGHPLLEQAEYEIAYPYTDDWQPLLGTEPCFIFHPHDPGNAALPGVHDRQIAILNTLPPGLRELFTRTFGPGLISPRRRSLPSNGDPCWRSSATPPSLVAARPSSTPSSAARVPPPMTLQLQSVRRPIADVHRLEVGGLRIVLTQTANLSASQIGLSAGGDRLIVLMAQKPRGFARIA